MKAQGARLIAPKFDVETSKQIMGEMRKMGVNINQIAKWCNTNANVSNEQVERLNFNIDQLKKEMGKLWQQLS